MDSINTPPPATARCPGESPSPPGAASAARRQSTRGARLSCPGGCDAKPVARVNVGVCVLVRGGGGLAGRWVGSFSRPPARQTRRGARHSLAPGPLAGICKALAIAHLPRAGVLAEQHARARALEVAHVERRLKLWGACAACHVLCVCVCACVCVCHVLWVCMCACPCKYYVQESNANVGRGEPARTLGMKSFASLASSPKAKAG